MEKKPNDTVVFYGPLPVNKPYPIIKPNDRIQLQPTVHPVAITPYISLEGEDAAEGVQAGEVAEEVAEQKTEKRASARVAGVIMLIISLLSIIVFALSMGNRYPIAAAEDYISLGYFFDMFKTMFADKQFTQFNMVFVPYLITVAYIAIIVNVVLSIIAIATGKRRGYGIFAFIAFLTLVVAAFYQMHFFSQIKQLGNLLNTEYGWACIMLIIIGGLNLIGSFLCSLICPKHKVIETVEF